MSWSELLPWPLPERQATGTTPEVELYTAEIELHQAAAARQYLGIRPQRTTTDIEAAPAAIEAARARGADAKQALRDAGEV